LEVLFHNLEGIDQGLMQQLDKDGRGYVELDELVELVEAKLQDPYLTMMKNYIQEGLEYKSSDKVYYSPLLGSLPPFFKYVQRFEGFTVIEKFNKELQSIDTNGSGFVPVNLFRSILEHELKIKEKIVVDFIQNMRETDQTQQL
jgi:Ca2+-binding EF-hand superfamily protein